MTVEEMQRERSVLIDLLHKAFPNENLSLVEGLQRLIRNSPGKVVKVLTVADIETAVENVFAKHAFTRYTRCKSNHPTMGQCSKPLDENHFVHHNTIGRWTDSDPEMIANVYEKTLPL